MKRAPYAVIDVETTHGDPRIGRIVEIGIVLHDGQGMLDAWSTLIHPQAPIPPFIRRLTGIGPEDLRQAPTFRQAARMVQGFTRGRIVVAHNARFDMTALSQAFAREGLCFARPTLCTEQLSRQLLPNLVHYNLASMCRHFGIPYPMRHRAHFDAMATAGLFSRLMRLSDLRTQDLRRA